MPTTTTAREPQGVPGTSGQQDRTVTKQHVAMRGGSNHTATTTTTLPSPSRHLLQFFQTDSDHDVSLNIYRGRRRHQHDHQQRYTFYYEPYQHSTTNHRRHRQRPSSKSSPLFPDLPSSSSSFSSSSSSSSSSFSVDSSCPSDEQLVSHSDIMDDTAIFDDFTQLAAAEDTFIPSSPSTTTIVPDDDFVLFP
ncbi:predicted protein [Lichtheimia corymbifera JMRC:FSU:9682]|uniref:Uncharacterized protein n=1 Tax=Lichtheimia corymbifera JMRC:FSU:9682 TaxID=1263082 RepID=A0A068S060_9FUNG|nr:predicted protein [Lichtheimia corymbifera JMRC:FSU:9682]